MNEIKKKGKKPRPDPAALKLKKKTGKRFRQFRDTIGKNQYQLADDLRVHQSTITNIEIGHTFPGIDYILYIYKKYNLNPTWLITGNGKMFYIDEEKHLKMSSIVEHIMKSDPDLEHFKLLEVPEVEQIILAKLVELKYLLKDRIQEFKESAHKREIVSQSGENKDDGK